MPETALYCRVSTEDQNLKRQKEETWDYAVETLGVEASTVTVYEDKASGRNVDRDGFQRLMSKVRDAEVGRVVVLELSRVTRSMRDLSSTVDELKENGTSLHIVNRRMDLDPDEPEPMTEAFFYLSGIFAQLEAEMVRERTISGIRAAKDAGKHTGRPPYGFDTDEDGYLVLNDNFDNALVILDELERGESKRSLARRFDVSRATVSNIEGKEEFYRGRAGVPKSE
jgi:DNA invertase Pin-like site-specific DNA recombinase